MCSVNELYSEKNPVIIDVTKAPYFADNTGRVDCTDVLRQAIDDVLLPNIIGVEKTKKLLMEMEDPNARISFEIRKENNVLNVIFPVELEKTRILYFPNGTYLVSDTISYTLENLKNIVNGVPHFELNRQLHFKGESRDGVIIKLADHCKGFEYGSDKPIVSFMRAEASNVSMSNTFEDITIDAGSGNAGAVGLVFFANNSGAVRNVRIISSDKDKRGYAGLEIKHEIVSGCYVKDVEIDGFDYGIRAIPVRNFAVFENIQISNQKKIGFFIKNMIISIRKLISNNKVPALSVDGALTHMALVDSEARGGSGSYPAIECKSGSCFIRNVDTEGYRCAAIYAAESVCEGNYIKEYLSDCVHTEKFQISVSCKVKNIGNYAGKEVVQLYIRPLDAVTARPIKELRSFEKVDLDAGEEKQVVFEMTEADFAYYNTCLHEWHVESGSFAVLVGASAQDIRLEESVSIIYAQDYTKDMFDGSMIL